jgi:uncharacterized membrane protein YedE/YeeE
MLETFGFEELTAPEAAVYFAIAVGVVFGALAQMTKFCFRRAIVGTDRRRAAGVWLTALAVAALGTQAAVSAQLISFEDHRFMASDLPILAIAVGGLLFGAGMVLTRGCVSRLTVLSGSGNLRAVLVLIVFAIVAHATLKGVLSPVRVALADVTIALETASLPGNPVIWASFIAVLSLAFALRSGNRIRVLLGAALIGGLVPLAWVGTGFILYDDFDPIALEGLSFTSPAAETLFWSIASTSISATFGVGLLAGVLAGAMIAALIRGQFQWQSFESPRQTGRYMTGASLMGIGGVLAGGCTVGAGLSGIPSLSISAILAIVSIAVGGWLAGRVLSASSAESGAASTTPPLQPAE